MAIPKGHTRKKEDVQPRPWPLSVGLASVFVAVALVLSATINPLFGRSVHWDWAAGLSAVLLVVLATAVRRRWV